MRLQSLFLAIPLSFGALTFACAGLKDGSLSAPESDGAVVDAPADGDALADSAPVDSAPVDAPDSQDAGAESPDVHEAGPPLSAPPTVRGPLIDFNGDHYADYAEHDLTTGAFRVYTNTKASGTLGFAQSAMNGTTCLSERDGVFPCDVLVGDFNGDGWGEYAEHDPSTGDLRIHLNQKDGTFAASRWGGGTTCTFDTSVESGLPCEVLVADFTGDGYADFADREPATGRVFIHPSNKDGTFAAAQASPSFVTCVNCDVLVADFTGDGYADFANRDPTLATFYIFANMRDGTFSQSPWGYGHSCRVDVWSSTPGARCDVLVGDVDGDGLADLVARSPSSGNSFLHPNLGAAAGGAPPWDVSEDSSQSALSWITCFGPSCEILGHRFP